MLKLIQGLVLGEFHNVERIRSNFRVDAFFMAFTEALAVLRIKKCDISNELAGFNSS